MKFKLKYLVLILFAFSVSLFGLTESEKKEIRDNLVKKRSYSNEKVSYTHTYLDEVEIEKDNKEYLNYDEFMYGFAKSGMNSENTIGTASTISTLVAFDAVGHEKIRVAELKKELAEQEANKESSEEKEEKIYNATGYCTNKYSIKVEKLSAYAYLDCDINGLGASRVAVMLVPDFYTQALVAKPLYIDNPKLKNRETKGVVLNANRTSINIASTINDYKIQKISAAIAKKTANIVTTQAQDYLAKKQESETESETTHIPTDDNNTIIESKNTNAPDKGDYIANATVQVLSGIVDIVGTAYINQFKYTFLMKENSVLYVDLLIGKQITSLHGVETNSENTFINKIDNNNVNEDNGFNFSNSSREINITK